MMQKNCLNVSISIISHHALHIITYTMQYFSKSIQSANMLMSARLYINKYVKFNKHN